jgi:hypothetical protein
VAWKKRKEDSWKNDETKAGFDVGYSAVIYIQSCKRNGQRNMRSEILVSVFSVSSYFSHQGNTTGLRAQINTAITVYDTRDFSCSN